jgi:hypothetical protein
MHNYVNKLTCLAMMNRNCVFDGSSGAVRFWKSKAANKLVVFGDDRASVEGLKQLTRMYLDSDPDIKGSYHMDEIVSEIDCAEFFDGFGESKRILNGRRFADMRGSINKWLLMMSTGRLTEEPLSERNLDEVIAMIEKWRYMENGGMKYMWQERAGCDKAFCSRIVSDFEGIRTDVIATAFRLDGECVAYSTIPMHPTSFAEDGTPYVTYLTRKVLNEKGRRNLTEFVDWFTFRKFHVANPEYGRFLVNWGASSGGVKWYKTHKFPLRDVERKWFVTLKGDAE